MWGIGYSIIICNMRWEVWGTRYGIQGVGCEVWGMRYEVWGVGIGYESETRQFKAQFKA